MGKKSRPKDRKSSPPQLRARPGTASRSTSASADFAIVGVAGDLPGFRKLLGSFPGDAGIALVLMDVGGSEDVALPLLSDVTALSVSPAADGITLEPNHVYTTPPGRRIELDSGRLRLEPAEERGGRDNPVDAFFRSLATTRRELAIGVLLAGTGKDGALGLKEIQAGGGLTLLPRAAATGELERPVSGPAASCSADFVVPIGEMPEIILRYTRHSLLASQAPLPESVSSHVDSIVNLLLARTGYDFRCFKNTTLSRRIARRMGLKRIEVISDYVTALKEDPDEIERLYRDLLISVTRFFRDPDAWKALDVDVVERLVAEKPDGEPFRVWIPGCATGEEAYSMAMGAIEVLERSGKDLDFQLFATDVDEDALDIARRGIYPGAIAAEVGPERLRRFFSRTGEGFSVSDALRDATLFATHDVLRDPPFHHLDLLSCRNLLIYLDTGAQKRLLGAFHFALRPGGYLFLGKSESAAAPDGLFEPVSGPWRIYRKLATAGSRRSSFPDSARPGPTHLIGRGAPILGTRFAEEIEQTLLSKHAPPSVVVDRQFRVHYFHGRVREYLDFPRGRPTSDLTTMLQNTYQGAVRSVVRSASKNRRGATALLSPPGRSERLRINCEPLTARKNGDPLFLVSFIDESASFPGREDSTREKDLETELRETQEELQRTIQEVQSSNEELKASNEEILLMNEELESSQGELQSLNEELAAVNHELEAKIAELESTTDDLSNFLASSEIATIFLDTSFRIRRFTPAMGTLMNVIPTDVGRPVSDLSHRIRDPELLADGKLVLSELRPIEKEVGSDDGRWFIRRILPYRTSSNRVEGVVVTFTDVTRLKETGERLKGRERQQAVVASLGTKALAEVPLQDLMDEAAARVAETLDNDFCEVLRLTADKNELELVAGVGWKEGLVGTTTVPATRHSHAGYTLESRSPVIVEDLARESRFSGPRLLLDHGVVSGVSVVIGPAERPWGVLGTHSRHRQVYTDDDVNFLQSVAHLLWQAIAAEKSRSAEKEHKQELALVADSAPVLIAYIDAGRRYRFTNAAYERWFGIPRGEIQGKTMRDFLGGETYRRIESQVATALSGERVKFELELPDERGRKRAGLVNYVPRRDGVGRVLGFYSVMADVTELKQAEERARESEERLRLSQRAGGVGTWDWDLGENRFTCSEEFFEIHGIDPTAEISCEDWIGRIDPQDRDDAERLLRRALEDRSSFEAEFRILRPDGPNRARWEERWVAARANVLPDGVGQAGRMVGVVIDVTFRKRAELQSERAQLELQRANELKDEFLAMLGHELRNPLGAISNGIQLLVDGVAAEHREWAEQMIARQTRQLERLVDDLLDASRITRGLIEIRKEVVPLARSVEQALESVRDLFVENEREVSLKLPEEPVFLMADPARLEQIFGNLLSNAVKYSEEGGRIELEAERAGSEVVVRVSDDGQGIPADALEVVFEPFVRVGQSLRRAGSGLGIGLTLVKKLTELHGGSVSVRSDGPGRGSEFTVRLPVYDGELRSRPEGAAARESAAENPLRILVIDDNRDLAVGLQKILEAMGHEVRLAHDGPEGLSLARSFDPHATLVDIGLPGMDGYEVATRLRDLGRMWIGAVSGYKQPGEEGLARGIFDHYFIKPLARDDLADALSALAIPGEVR